MSNLGKKITAGSAGPAASRGMIPSGKFSRGTSVAAWMIPVWALARGRRSARRRGREGFIFAGGMGYSFSFLGWGDCWCLKKLFAGRRWVSGWDGDKRQEGMAFFSE